MTVEPISVCLAGATGWAGSELARAIAAAADLRLAAGVSRTHAGRSLGDVLGDASIDCPLYGSAAEALAQRSSVAPRASIRSSGLYLNRSAVPVGHADR
jgi:4-hydroxy-tetrahydrodipicolinate reductase